MSSSSKDLKIRYIGDATGVQKTLGQVDRMHSAASSKLQALGTKMVSAGKTMTTAVTLPVVAGLGLAFDAASDLNESMSKVDVVFGKNAGTIQKWSSTSATAMGLSQQQALESAGTFGNLFRAMDLGTGPATTMSKNLVGLSADLASFNNADPTQVLEALRSGIVGEAEPLRKFGIQISAARIEQEAYRMGLAKTGDELTAGQKAQAAYALIMKDSKLAQGDFARTADGAANKMRILKAQAIDAAAGIGKTLLPIGQKLLGWVTGLITKFNALSPGAKNVIITILAVAAAVGPLLIVVGKAIAVFKMVGTVFMWLTRLMATNPWLLLIAAVVLLVIIIVKNWSTIKAFLLAVWNKIKQAATAVWNAIKGVLLAVWRVIAGAVKTYFNIYKTVILTIWKVISTVGRAIWSGIKAYLTVYWKVISSVARAVWNGIKMVIVGPMLWVRDKIGQALSWIREKWSSIWHGLASVAGSIWSTITGGIRAGINGVIGVVESAINALITAYNKAADLPLNPMPHVSPVSLPRVARGGRVQEGGWAMVGEQGPELVRLGGGATVFPHNASKELAGARGGGGTIVVHVHVAGSVMAERELAETVQKALLRVKRRNAGGLGLA